MAKENKMRRFESGECVSYNGNLCETFTTSQPVLECCRVCSAARTTMISRNIGNITTHVYAVLRRPYFMSGQPDVPLYTDEDSLYSTAEYIPFPLIEAVHFPSRAFSFLPSEHLERSKPSQRQRNAFFLRRRQRTQ